MGFAPAVLSLSSRCRLFLKRGRAVIVQSSWTWDLVAALALRKLTAPPLSAVSTRGGLAHLPRASTRDAASGVRLGAFIMSEDSRLRKLLAAALVELHRLDETVYQQARGRVEAFAPDRFAEILARHDDFYKPPERPGFADPSASRCRRPAAAAASRRRSLCQGYATAAAAGVRRRCRRKTDGGLCVFSTARPGTPARTTGERCVFCSPQRMLLATRQPVPLQNLKADLGKLERKAPWVHDRAHERLQRHLPRSEYKKVLTPKHCCRGRGEDMCIFSSSTPGAPARVAESASLCIWCDPDRLAAAEIRGKNGAAVQVRYFREHCPAAYAKADRNVRDLFGDDYAATYFAAGRAREGRRAARVARRRGTADWTDALKKRKLRTQAPEEEPAARRKYRKLVLDDRKKVQNSLFPGTTARQDRRRRMPCRRTSVRRCRLPITRICREAWSPGACAAPGPCAGTAAACSRGLCTRLIWRAIPKSTCRPSSAGAAAAIGTTTRHSPRTCRNLCAACRRRLLQL